MTTTWSKLISRAEKLLGGPSPYINLGNILSSEAGSLASRARRLAGNVNHPFFSTVRSCLRGRYVNNLFSISSAISDRFSKSVTSERPSGGLIILLVGQSYASPTNSTKLCSQHRSISEIFETVHTAVAIHKSLVNLNDLNQNTDDNETWLKNMEICNKLATLSGDVLLASVSTSLAKLHHANSTNQTTDAYCSIKKEMQCMKNNMYRHQTVIPYYSEYGLNEPTFADALLLSLSSSKTHYKLVDVIDEVLSEYNRIGRELAQKLRESFDQMVFNAEQFNIVSDNNNSIHIKETNNCSPGIQLLGEMVDKLISDCNCPS
ncbi:unnamed protein product [Schistosoma rodhaini]|nr:unnamed protein product [Schistosoma rodhaini]